MTCNASSPGLGDHCIITMLLASGQERLRPGQMQPGRFHSAPLLKTRVAALMVVLLLAVPALAADFELTAIGDTRPRFESESLQAFESLTAEINGLKPALLGNLGDLINGYGIVGKEKHWHQYQTVTKISQVPCHQLSGNHDTRSKEAQKICAQGFGKFYQSFDYGDCHFVPLDNTEQERWGHLWEKTCHLWRRLVERTNP